MSLCCSKCSNPTSWGCACNWRPDRPAIQHAMMSRANDPKPIKSPKEWYEKLDKKAKENSNSLFSSLTSSQNKSNDTEKKSVRFDENKKNHYDSEVSNRCSVM